MAGQTPNSVPTGGIIYTPYDRSTAVTGTAKVLAAQNLNRVALEIVNDLAVNVWINQSAIATAAPGGGNKKIAPGARYELPSPVDYRPISIIAEGAGGNITATEFY